MCTYCETSVFLEEICIGETYYEAVEQLEGTRSTFRAK